jgi:ketosteroid isomerase-like protein
MTDITSLMAEIGIRQLHARYIDAVWRKDYTAFAECFAQDCEWRIAGTVVKGREAAVTFIGRMFDDFKSIFVQLSTPILTVGDAEASGRTYFTARNIFKDGKPFAPMGMYYERFVREGDAWRFKWRLFQTHYSGAPDLSGTYNAQTDYGPPPNMPPLDAVA